MLPARVQYFSHDYGVSPDTLQWKKKLPVERLSTGATRLVEGSLPRSEARRRDPDRNFPIDMTIAGIGDDQKPMRATFDCGNGGFVMPKDLRASATRQLKGELDAIPDCVVRNQDWQARSWQFLPHVRVSCAEFKFSEKMVPEKIMDALIHDGYICEMRVRPKEQEVHARYW